MIDTPIAIFIFNRPKLTADVLSSLRELKPKKLYVIADGPRESFEEDKSNCHKTRSLFENINWDCDVVKNYSEENLGCKKRVSSGISWVFETEEKAIILEDDTVPSLSFFKYCDQLLDYYKEDERIFSISGSNFQKQSLENFSYYFSIFNHCWGWATWKRAWNYFDYDMTLWNTDTSNDILENIFHSKKSRYYWKSVFDDTYNNRNSSWAYRWTFSCWANSGLTILPSVNLVKNIGFANDSTHTKIASHPLSNLVRNEIQFPLKHPPNVMRNKEADDYTSINYFNQGAKIYLQQRLNELVNNLRG